MSLATSDGTLFPRSLVSESVSYLERRMHGGLQVEHDAGQGGVARQGVAKSHATLGSNGVMAKTNGEPRNASKKIAMKQDRRRGRGSSYSSVPKMSLIAMMSARN